MSVINKLLNPILNSLRLRPSPVARPIVSGLIEWNDDERTANIHDGQGHTLQIGQELNIPVFNDTGSDIPNGAAVFIDSAINMRPTVALADNKDCCIARKEIGITTEIIPSGGSTVGKITTFGKVHDLDTSAFSDGDSLYVGEVPGSIVNVAPTGSRWKINLGFVANSHESDGVIFVRNVVYEQPDELINTTGFPNQNNPISEYTFTNGTRTFLIQPKAPSTEFNFYQLGVQYRKTIAETIVITDVEGMHYIYYDNGVLTEIVNPTDGQIDSLIRTKVTVAAIYWDADSNTGILIGDERHGHDMASDTRAYLHFVNKARWLSGMALNTINATGDGSANSHAQFGVDTGLGADEDKVSFASAILASAGLPIFYLTGAGNLRRTSLAGYSVLTDVAAGVGATGRIVYNRFSGGVYDLVVINDNEYGLCHVFETNDSSQPYIAFIGQASYSSVANARTGATSEMGTLRTAYAKNEIIPVATVIFNTKNTYTNAVKAKIVIADTVTNAAYVDWRTTTPSGSTGASPTDHNSLSGKQGGTPGEYYHLTAAEAANSHAKQHAITSSIDHTSSATPGQMLKADANGLPINATNTDAQVSAAVTASHARQHAITSASDHTSSATSGQMLKADANGLPVNATNTDAQVSAAVTASHSAVTLAASADTLLSLSTQQLSLDTQAANTVLAGPTTGAAAAPTMRALVVADLPAHTHSKLVASDGSPDPALSADASGNIGAVANINIPSGYTYKINGSSVVSQDVTSTASPTFAAVKTKEIEHSTSKGNSGLMGGGGGNFDIPMLGWNGDIRVFYRASGSGGDINGVITYRYINGVAGKKVDGHGDLIEIETGDITNPTITPSISGDNVRLTVVLDTGITARFWYTIEYDFYDVTFF